VAQQGEGTSVYGFIIFDPGTASPSAAAFSALLAALLFAVLGQLATSRGRRGEYPRSLKLGLVLLVSLLATTYMFVLLSGLRVTSKAEQTSLLRGSAFLFILCGSALAVAAAVTFLFLGFVLSEARRDPNDQVRDVAYQALLGGVAIDMVFLGFGYGDIASAFSAPPWSVPLGVGLLVAPVMVVLIIPKLAAWVVGCGLGRWVRRRLVLVAIGWLVALPVLVFRIFLRYEFPSTGDGWIAGALTATCALWAGLSFAACLRAAPRRPH
jgi:hypothetical protein